MIATVLVLMVPTPSIFADTKEISLRVLDTNKTGIFDDSAAEILSYDPLTKRLFVTNGATNSIDVIDISDPSNIVLISSIEVGGSITSVDVKDGKIATAIQTDSGFKDKVEFYDSTTLDSLGFVEVGEENDSLPDMVIFTPDGSKVLVALEGEPTEDYCGGTDPEGAIAIIDISDEPPVVSHATFDNFNSFEDELNENGVRIFGPPIYGVENTVAKDLEPEYIAVSGDGTTAWVSLQENNALAVIDIDSSTVSAIHSFGTKDHSKNQNAFDASNKDNKIKIKTWPTLGMYQPDTIVSYQVNGQTYIVSANEGDARDYDCFSEEARVKDVSLNKDNFPNKASLQKDKNLGRLKITNTAGDVDGDGTFEKLYSYGARSFSIWNTDGTLVFDSKDTIERKIAELLPSEFGSTDDENESFDDRSDDKGPEPETLAIGEINGKTYAFIGLERIGGIMIFNISNPESPEFMEYFNNRNFSVPTVISGNTNPAVGDLAPEGIEFIHATDSPNGKPLLAVANEVSGTTTIYEINVENNN